MRVWRICKQKHAAAAFSGEGARLFSGRWNQAGVRMVYCSTSLALAALEFFVHLDPDVAPEDLVSTMAEIPEGQVKVEHLEEALLPRDWRSLEHPRLQAIGAEWANSLRSIALAVPSAVIDGECNVLLNPAHPEFSRIALSAAKPFVYDARMFR